MQKHIHTSYAAGTARHATKDTEQRNVGSATSGFTSRILICTLCAMLVPHPQRRVARFYRGFSPRPNIMFSWPGSLTPDNLQNTSGNHYESLQPQSSSPSLENSQENPTRPTIQKSIPETHITDEPDSVGKLPRFRVRMLHLPSATRCTHAAQSAGKRRIPKVLQWSLLTYEQEPLKACC